jgi:hypothetical protein
MWPTAAARAAVCHLLWATTVGLTAVAHDVRLQPSGPRWPPCVTVLRWPPCVTVFGGQN